MNPMSHPLRILALLLLTACAPTKPAPPPARGTGEQVVACGERFDVGRRVVLWTDEDGFNAYTDPPPFNDRVTRDEKPLYDWTLPRLRRVVDQVVIHYDSIGSSAGCFEILRKRGLSAHFLIDTDGTIYQTLDLRERAWHAGVANSRSVGIEVAHPGVTMEPAPGSVRGEIQYRVLYQKPFTDAQYAALADLLAALRRVFPRVALDYPHETGLLGPERFAAFKGVLGHYHVSREKVDPGPAFDWRRLMRETARREAEFIIVTR